MFKKLAYAGAAAGTVAALLFLKVMPARADAAVVIKDGGCNMLNGNGGFAAATSDQSVGTSSDNSKITCRSEVTPSTTVKKAVHWNFENTGLLCNTNFGLTEDWEEVVTPSGQATLTCHINPSSL